RRVPAGGPRWRQPELCATLPKEVSGASGNARKQCVLQTQRRRPPMPPVATPARKLPEWRTLCRRGDTGRRGEAPRESRVVVEMSSLCESSKRSDSPIVRSFTKQERAFQQPNRRKV